jgi:hypothetical protein
MHMSRVHRACLLLPFVVACHHRVGSAPVLESLAPASADISRSDPVNVTITGRGFDSLNTVYFGRVQLRQVPRTTATSVRIAVPRDDEQVPDRGGAPVLPLPSGIYEVRVGTARGVSNALPFTLTGAVR